MKKENIMNYGTIILSVLLVALLGTIFTNNGMNWYNNLLKPNEWVPKSLIPIMWSIIYSLFTIYLVKNNKLNKKLVTLLIINGFFNVLWCLVYFSLNQLFLGLIIIVFNLIGAYLLIKEIIKSNKVYGYLLSIYPLWLSIATTLNLAVWILN